jgi:uncharacterized ferritin-like protein (DUF455 family)
MVHEARGLDVNPSTIKKFRNNKDKDTVAKLEIIHSEEVTVQGLMQHVATGQRWFAWICHLKNIDKYTTFHAMVKQYFFG